MDQRKNPWAKPEDLGSVLGTHGRRTNGFVELSSTLHACTVAYTHRQRDRQTHVCTHAGMQAHEHTQGNWQNYHIGPLICQVRLLLWHGRHGSWQVSLNHSRRLKTRNADRAYLGSLIGGREEREGKIQKGRKGERGAYTCLPLQRAEMGGAIS